MSNCATCKHRQALYLKCQAFPWGIPLEVVRGEKKHDSKIEGQRGKFVYELNPLYNCPGHREKAERRYEVLLKMAITGGIK